jgi:hypothetical protein
MLKNIRGADHICPYLDQVEVMSDDETLVAGDVGWNPAFDANTRQMAVSSTVMNFYAPFIFSFYFLLFPTILSNHPLLPHLTPTRFLQ